MDFKISDTNRGNKSLLHNGYCYRIENCCCSDFHLPVGEQGRATDVGNQDSMLLREELWLNLAIITLVLIGRYNHSIGIP